MADMHKFPRNSVELGGHESVVTVSAEDKIKTLAIKSLSLKSVAILLAACVLLFLGVMAVAHLDETSKNRSKVTGPACWAWPLVDCPSWQSWFSLCDPEDAEGGLDGEGEKGCCLKAEGYEPTSPCLPGLVYRGVCEGGCSPKAPRL
jgi:hypothetical protein